MKLSEFIDELIELEKTYQDCKKLPGDVILPIYIVDNRNGCSDIATGVSLCASNKHVDNGELYELEDGTPYVAVYIG